MGYSIATLIKSEKAKKKMMEFLSRNFNSLGDYYISRPSGSGLAYDHGPRRIGFDGTITTDYMVSLCAWMALKVGRVQVFPTRGYPNVAGPHKVIRYDGITTWPLAISQRYRDNLRHYVQVNWIGVLQHKSHWLRAPYNLAPSIIEEELKRLDALWNKQP